MEGASKPPLLVPRDRGAVRETIPPSPSVTAPFTQGRLKLVPRRIRFYTEPAKPGVISAVGKRFYSGTLPADPRCTTKIRARKGFFAIWERRRAGR